MMRSPEPDHAKKVHYLRNPASPMARETCQPIVPASSYNNPVRPDPAIPGLIIVEETPITDRLRDNRGLVAFILLTILSLIGVVAMMVILANR